MVSTGSDCPVCAFKHLAVAKVAVEEFTLGWNEPIHAAKVIGNLAHAEQHLLAVGDTTSLQLAFDIRRWRNMFEDASDQLMGDITEERPPIHFDDLSSIREWIAKLDEFIKRSDNVIKGISGPVGHAPVDHAVPQDALNPATTDYVEYRDEAYTKAETVARMNEKDRKSYLMEIKAKNPTLYTFVKEGLRRLREEGENKALPPECDPNYSEPINIDASEIK